VITIRRWADGTYNVKSDLTAGSTGLKHASQVLDLIWQWMPPRDGYALVWRPNELVIVAATNGVAQVDPEAVIVSGTPREIYDAVLPHLRMMRTPE